MADLKMVTLELCDEKLRHHRSILEAVTECVNDEEKYKLARAYVMVWERIRFHVENGKMVTIDEEGRFQLFQDDELPTN